MSANTDQVVQHSLPTGQLARRRDLSKREVVYFHSSCFKLGKTETARPVHRLIIYPLKVVVVEWLHKRATHCRHYSQLHNPCHLLFCVASTQPSHQWKPMRLNVSFHAKRFKIGSSLILHGKPLWFVATIMHSEIGIVASMFVGVPTTNSVSNRVCIHTL